MMLNLKIFFFISSCFMYSYYYKHILLTLISLEFMMVNMIYNLYYMMMINEINLFMITIFLGISVCESVLGLSLLINLVRLSGNDYNNNMKLLKC
ncbi:NADH dehydrogenase subunit 4L (mitochondrion) [Aphidius gifuensis]|uniref:NADH-ubiquinone oxidoreductase chain 4L n=1 Tax=Aphidius gifuensis TaxID=684658 RepID=A0A7S8HPM1_APHGI|nr:NADH dehydrogenase subunit 4L [Aphidius gifuensis]QPC56179.1 NADH dehydrogenase subunit 4L [Aphidius gifuensis]WLE65869.1 NADH dehydrogenase subunit 4l [Aphidius gifuensis]WLE65882.1 NADH dehydrogenase subunit 4l [Aphidius gifuensis]WLE65895.1 NADH dehydrogenase subunit 4l [Aphidius gifuensis]WLE65908.1 NADH dehydrogenase subunit 4l [Aphidius gifuensis]